MHALLNEYTQITNLFINELINQQKQSLLV